jgi:mannan endo-1,6-alpha-mannosidase
MNEPACDQNMMCDRDQNCFKGILSSYFAFTTYLKPDTAAQIMPKLQGSAEGAVQQCSGPGNDGRQCGLRWWQDTWDGTSGIEQEASVLSVVSATLAGMTGGPPVTASTGGTSKSDPGAAGNDTSTSSPGQTLTQETTADRAGAGILTVLVLVAMVGGGAWLL